MKPRFSAPKMGRNRWCGPAAISILTGCDTDKAAERLRKVSGRERITGTHTWEVRAALKRFWHMDLVKVQALDFWVAKAGGQKYLGVGSGPPTLVQWLKTFKRKASDVYLIVVGRHWIVVKGRRCSCSLTRAIVPFDHTKVKRRSRVTEVYRVTAET